MHARPSARFADQRFLTSHAFSSSALPAVSAAAWIRAPPAKPAATSAAHPSAHSQAPILNLVANALGVFDVDEAKRVRKSVETTRPRLHENALGLGLDALGARWRCWAFWLRFAFRLRFALVLARRHFIMRQRRAIFVPNRFGLRSAAPTCAEDGPQDEPPDKHCLRHRASLPLREAAAPLAKHTRRLLDATASQQGRA